MLTAYGSQVGCDFSLVDNGGMSISIARMGACQTGNNFASRYRNRGSLFVFHTRLPSIVYHFDLINTFQLTISGARGRARPLSSEIRKSIEAYASPITEAAFSQPKPIVQDFIMIDHTVFVRRVSENGMFLLEIEVDYKIVLGATALAQDYQLLLV